ncbi:hypothetical protein ACFLZH_05775 [Patescibacteria group bacterium]
MDKQILEKHIFAFLKDIKKNPEKYKQEYQERIDHINYYSGYSKEKILKMNIDDMYIYLSKLWAMLIWGNKHYIVDKIIEENGFDKLKKNIANLIWGNEDIAERWDEFRSNIKGVGPAMMSELLCKAHPDELTIWNNKAKAGFKYLEVENLPTQDYQVNGEIYSYLCIISQNIAKELKKAGIQDTSLLAVDYFIWNQLQIKEEDKKTSKKKKEPKTKKLVDNKFIHNDIRDKLRDIGQWLGFNAKIEHKVAAGAKVDTIWEATIANMGRVIYIFEVQTKGSIDSLTINLIKSLNNPAVQGVVAVSDKDQIEKIKKHTDEVKDLKDKLKFWDYEEVLKVHESLEFVNASINNLDLVPESFY